MSEKKVERLCQLGWQEDAGSWDDELQKEYDDLKKECVRSLKLQELLKERIDELSPCNSASDEYDEFMILLSLEEESKK